MTHDVYADPGAEREVDLRSVWRRIADRWWLPVLGLLAGLLAGLLLSLGGGSVYEAKTLLYLGQPFTPQGGGQIQSLQTNPKTVSEIIRSEAALARAAKAAGLRPGQLRRNVTSQAITSPGQGARTLSPLVEIVVQAPSPRQAELAAESFTENVIGRISTYVDSKIVLLKQQITALEQELDRLDQRVALAQAQQREILASTKLPLSERLLVSTNLNSTLGFAEQRRGTVTTDLASAQQLLSLAESVERSRLIEPAEAVRTIARSRRKAMLAGALLGLLLGAAAALVADPLLARRAGSAP